MPAIVLVPGLNCSARVFLPQLPDLWRHGPVTVADHRSGDSIAEIAGNVLASAPPSFALAGFSLGGYIALEMIRQAPERVERLALLATNARPDTAEQAERRRLRMQRVASGAFEEDLREQFPTAVAPGAAGDAALLSTYLEMAHESGPDAFIRHSRAIIARPDQRPLLPRITCPTLVVAAADDQIMPAAVTDELAAGIPRARLVTVAGSGHMLPLEQPARLGAALAAWLD